MAAGGFKEFVAGEVLDEDEINDYLMQGVLVFAGTAARGSAITSPVEGQFAFLKDSDQLTYYSGTAWEVLETADPIFDYLIIGGGGGGRSVNSESNRSSGGGGAGGYRCSVTGENSGGGLSASLEPKFVFANGASFTVTVGAGGPGGTTNGSGFASVCANPSSVGGGRSGGLIAGSVVEAATGGSGGGAYTGGNLGAAGTAGQGFKGGDGADTPSIRGGGGGGASAAGQNGSTASDGNGGAGVSSSITGTSVGRGGGGGGGRGGSATDGGGAGGTLADGSNASPNTGGGGGGANTQGGTVRNGGNGGSGIVVLKYPDKVTLTIGAGLTSSTTTSGGFKVTQFTAGTDTVTVNF